MPLAHIEMLSARSAEKKLELAREIARAFETVIGSKSAHVAALFSDIAPSDGVVAGEALGSPSPHAPQQGN